MLLSSQVQVVRQWIVDSIAAAVADGFAAPAIELDRIVWQRQDWPDRPYPYVVLGYTGSAEQGISPAQWIDGADALNTRTGDETTLSIKIVAMRSDTAPTLDQQASSYARELKCRLRSFAADPLRLAHLAVRAVNVIPDVSALQGASQWESSAVLDITFGHAAVITEAPGIIEHVEVTGTTTPATPSQTFSIPA